MTTTHSPKPWTLGDDGCIRAADGTEVAWLSHGTHEADFADTAAEIVAAANLHDDLVAIAKDHRDLIRSDYEGKSGISKPMRPQFDRAEAALAKAGA